MRCVIALVALLLAVPAAQAQSPDRPIVVELFTSQGCNSCPPADEFLRELSARRDVLALEFHVDYWDYIGWRDPFAQRHFTDRQRAYSRAMEQRYVYTPQMVIDGRFQEVGSDREAVLRLIERARTARGAGLTIEAGQGERASVRIRRPFVNGPAMVWAAVALDLANETDVLRGENGGRRLVNTNTVRRMQRLGTYNGTAEESSDDRLRTASGRGDRRAGRQRPRPDRRGEADRAAALNGAPQSTVRRSHSSGNRRTSSILRRLPTPGVPPGALLSRDHAFHRRRRAGSATGVARFSMSTSSSPSS